VGKSFRNEISPRQSLIRLRELIQAEVEVFFNPKAAFDRSKLEKMKDVRMNVLLQSDTKVTKEVGLDEALKAFGGLEIIAYYFALLQNFYESVGFEKKNTRFRELSPADRAFYTTSAFDFEVYTASLGWVELVACNYRTDYDLSNHSRTSKKDLAIMDGEEKVTPHVVELSLGVDRSLFCLLDTYFVHEQNRDVLRLPANVSPYLAAVFPLISKPQFESRAIEIYETLKKEEFSVFYDDSGNIGRRYRRMDEIGTPYCVTLDPQSLEDNMVTIRERDSMKQERVPISEIASKLRALKGQKGN
jgi:glycyl-tRNA synthetase